MIQKLYSAQRVLMRFPSSAPEHQETLAQLQQEIPSAILAHFLRLVEQGSKGAAPVVRDVCSSCHMRIPSGAVGALRHPEDLVLCESCGAYLFVPEEELRAAPVSKPKVARRKKPVATAAAAGLLSSPPTVVALPDVAASSAQPSMRLAAH